MRDAPNVFALKKGSCGLRAIEIVYFALRPQVPWAYASRGLTLALLRRFDEANDDFNRAIALQPGFVPAHLKLVRFQRLDMNYFPGSLGA